MLTDRLFVHPTTRAMDDHCYYLKRGHCYKYVHHYSGRTSFLDILHKETPQEAAKAAFGKYENMKIIDLKSKLMLLKIT